MTPLSLLENARDVLIEARRSAETFHWPPAEMKLIDLAIRLVCYIMRRRREIPIAPDFERIPDEVSQ